MLAVSNAAIIIVAKIVCITVAKALGLKRTINGS